MSWWQYLMLVNVYLLLFYGFYALLLRKETFFQLNRIYLVAAAALSFFIPLVQSDWVKNLFITQKVQYTIYGSPMLMYRFKPVEDTHFTIGEICVIIYLAGIVFLLARFCWQMRTLRRIIANEQTSSAWSFFKKVNVDETHENAHVIAAHENVHASEWHSADVLVMEGVMIINWFNPVVYLYRFAIKHIHEYIADSKAIKSGTDKADYALILLSQTFNAPAHQLVNPFFNKSLLKQRIMMLQKNKSHRIKLFKYFLSAPLFILMLILSSATVNNSKTVKFINKKVQSVFLKPAAIDGSPAADAGKSKKVVLAINGQPLIYDVTIDPNHNATDTTPKKNKVFTSVEKYPSFPGGFNEFVNYLAKNIRYPAKARENKTQGRVIIGFIVEEDGALTDVRVLRGIGDGADEEAMRVIQASPKWEPGIQNGKPVRTAFTVPISFTLMEASNQTGAVINNQDTSSLKSNKMIADTAKGQFAKSKALLVVNGVPSDNISISSINPNDIESIYVLKSESAVKLYGPKGANGAILINLKNNPNLKKKHLQPDTTKH